jgi:hypothetical protein
MTMTEQSPTRYPESWKPRGAPDFEPEEPEPSALKPLEMELAAAAMSDEEWAVFVRRARGSLS